MVSGGYLTYVPLADGAGNAAAHATVDAEDGGQVGDEWAAFFMEAQADASAVGEQVACVIHPTIWDKPSPKGAAAVHAVWLVNQGNVGRWTGSTITPKYVDQGSDTALDLRGDGDLTMGLTLDKVRDRVTMLFPSGRVRSGDGAGFIEAETFRYLTFEGFDNNPAGTQYPWKIKRVYGFKATPEVSNPVTSLEAVQRAIDNRPPSTDPVRPVAKVLVPTTPIDAQAPNGSWGDIDTNCTVTFTAPPSGAVMIRFDAWLDWNSSTLQLRVVNTSGGASLRSTLVAAQPTTPYPERGMKSFGIPINGLTAGQSYTVKLQQFQSATYAANSAGSRFYISSTQMATLTATPLETATYFVS